MVVWITGLSGCGKTTLCQEVISLVKSRLPNLVCLDGDVIRAIMGNDLEYTEQDRVLQVRRLQNLARELSRQDLVVLVGVVYTHPDLLAWNRSNFDEYFEVYLKAPMHFLRRRDPKKLYARASAGEITNVVGVDIPWYPPESPDMVIDATEMTPPDQLALRLAQRVPALSAALPDTDVA
jgi:adenylylsulfate kinase